MKLISDHSGTIHERGPIFPARQSSMPIRCVTFEIANTLVRLASPQHALYRKPVCDALRHFRLAVPPDDVMKNAFRVAFKRVSTELPHYGGPSEIDERVWWKELMLQMLEEAGCHEALSGGNFHLVFQRAYSSFGSRDSWSEAPDGAREAMKHAKAHGLVVGAVCNTYHRYVDNKLPMLGLHADLDFAVVSNEASLHDELANARRAAICNDATRAGESALWQLQVVWELAARRATDAHRLLHGGESPIAPEHMLHVGTSLPGFLAAKACGARALLIDARPDPRKFGLHSSHDGAVNEKLSPEETLSSLRELPAKVDELRSTRQ